MIWWIVAIWLAFSAVLTFIASGNKIFSEQIEESQVFTAIWSAIAGIFAHAREYWANR